MRSKCEEIVLKSSSFTDANFAMFTWSLLIGIASTLVVPGTTADDFGTICQKYKKIIVTGSTETYKLFDITEQRGAV